MFDSDCPATPLQFFKTYSTKWNEDESQLMSCYHDNDYLKEWKVRGHLVQTPRARAHYHAGISYRFVALETSAPLTLRGSLPFEGGLYTTA